MDLFERKLTVTSDYTAMNGYMRPSALFGILQTAAFEDASNRGAGKESTSDRGILWMVVHMHVEVTCLPEYCGECSVVTWPGGGKHGLFTRFYELHSTSGAPVVRASGTWVLVDAVTRSLVPGAGLEMPCVTTGREIEPPRRLRIPELENSTAFTAHYSQMDINGHMNNAKYLDAAEDLLPADYLMSHTLRSADVDYLCEVRPGESLTIRWGEKDGAWWFQGETDKPCFRIKLTYR